MQHLEDAGDWPLRALVLDQLSFVIVKDLRLYSLSTVDVCERRKQGRHPIIRLEFNRLLLTSVGEGKAERSGMLCLFC